MCILLLTGCASVKLYPIADDHIIQVGEGQTFTTPRDGYFISTEYLKRILDAQVEKGF
mgnify:CR=1 FL=1